MKKVGIIGGSGFIGSYNTRKFLKEGYHVKDPKTELFDPTVKGTENFLEAIQKTPGIERVVFIASVAA